MTHGGSLWHGDVLPQDVIQVAIAWSMPFRQSVAAAYLLAEQQKNVSKYHTGEARFADGRLQNILDCEYFPSYGW